MSEPKLPRITKEFLAMMVKDLTNTPPRQGRVSIRLAPFFDTLVQESGDDEQEQDG